MGEVASKGRKSTTIGDLPNGILHTILEFVPIQDAARTSVLSKKWIPIWSTQPHLVFDPLFFQYVSNIGASAAAIIYKILMQHTGNIMGFHLISSTCKLAQSDVDQFIIFVSKHGIQKHTLDMANEENYMLPNRIFTCATLTHLKLSRCFFKLPDGTQFPNLISLQLEHSKIAGHLGSEDDLNLPMLETLELRFCIGVDSVNLVSPKLDNMSIVSSYTITFYCFNVNPIFAIIKHLCLNGTSLENYTGFMCKTGYTNHKLRGLKICDFKISVESISCVFCLLRSSPILHEIEIDEVVKVDETLRDSMKLLSYLSREEDRVEEALGMIRTMRLRKFKGSSTEMYLIRVLISHSKKLERMIIEQCDKGNATSFEEQLSELLSCIPRASPKSVVVKYSRMRRSLLCITTFMV
ncbi:hypothetical protein KY285_023150 [Solanum tuberosum]|nr:hypothetical protein KY285_023150 [Solanum tuberosum]